MQGHKKLGMKKAAVGMKPSADNNLQKIQDIKQARQLLQKYSQTWEKLPDFGMGAHVRIISNILVIRRLEQELEKPDCAPYEFLSALLQEQIAFMTSLQKALPAIGFAQEANPAGRLLEDRNYDDKKFQEIYRDLWSKFDVPLMDSFSKRISKRLLGVGITKDFFKDKKVLDIGYGSGVYSVYAATSGAKFCLGVDPNAFNLKHAKGWATSVGVDAKCHFQIGSAYKIKSKSDFHDFAICSGVIHHLEQPLMGLKEINRVLKDGGNFLMIVEGKGGLFHDVCDAIELLWRKRSPDSVKKILEEYHISPNTFAFFIDSFFTQYHRKTINGYDRLLKLAGFEVLKIYRYAPLRIPFPYKEGTNFDACFGDGNLCILCKKSKV